MTRPSAPQPPTSDTASIYEPYSSLSRRNSQLYEPASATLSKFNNDPSQKYPRDSSLSKYNYTSTLPSSASSSFHPPTAPLRRSSITSQNNSDYYSSDAIYGATPKYSALSSSASTANVYTQLSQQQQQVCSMSNTPKQNDYF